MAKSDETLEMALLFTGGMTMQQIGEQYRVSRQTVQQRLASVDITGDTRPPKHTLIDKNRLEVLYAGERLSIDKIGAAFGVSPYIIHLALEFYKIPVRRSIQSDGKYVDILRRLEIGETAEIECPAKKPYVVLHKSAKGVGAKISVKKIESGKFRVTKIS